jgi:hypothetical protein
VAEEPKATKHSSLNYITRKRTQLRKSNIVRPSFFGTVTKAIDESYSFDLFSKAGPYRALVLRVDEQVTPPPNNPLQTIPSFFGFSTELTVLAIKAKIIDDFDSALPMPTALGSDDGDHQYVIDLHDTFYASTPETNDAANIKAGDIVLVDYMDRVNKSDPVIVGLTRISSPLDGFGVIKDKLIDLLKQIPGIPDSLLDSLNTSDDECGENEGIGVHPRQKCTSNYKIKHSVVYETEDTEEYRLLATKLQTLKQGTWIENYSANDLDSIEIVEVPNPDDPSQIITVEKFNTDDSKGIITIDYNWTMRSRCDGHIKWCDTIKKVLIKMADYYIEQGQPDKAAMIQHGNTKRTKKEQRDLRIFYCVPPDDPRCNRLNGQPCKGKKDSNGAAISDDQLFSLTNGRCANATYCDRPVCVGNGKGSHEVGEATDFSLAIWPKDSTGNEIYTRIETIDNNTSRANLDKQFANPARSKIAELGQTGAIEKFKPISDNSEGWHFSSWGG